MGNRPRHISLLVWRILLVLKGGYTHDLLKLLGEIAGIADAHGHGNLLNRPLRFPKKFAGHLDSLLQNEVRNRLSGLFMESSGKIIGTQELVGGDLLGGDGICQIQINVEHCFPDGF